MKSVFNKSFSPCCKLVYLYVLLNGKKNKEDKTVSLTLRNPMSSLSKVLGVYRESIRRSVKKMVAAGVLVKTGDARNSVLTITL